MCYSVPRHQSTHMQRIDANYRGTDPSNCRSDARPDTNVAITYALSWNDQQSHQRRILIVYVTHI
jgi:hypothetical protein